jgi:hypothetical protein
MAAQVALKDLIEALAGAIVEAQDRIEQHQIANLSSYFDADNRPKSVLIRLPSMHPQAAEGDEDLYRAPLLPLVSTNLLKIKDVELSFDVDLGEVAGDLSPPPAATAPDAGRPEAQSPWRDEGASLKKKVQVHTRSGLLGRRSSTVHVVLRVEGSEPTDGISRLTNHLMQTQGVFKTVKND